MKKILVTGGSGFIGSNFIRYMLKSEDDIEIVNLDSLTYAGNPQNLIDIQKNFSSRYSFVRGDICDGRVIDRVFSDNSPDAVINFAAESHVDRSIEDPNVFIKTNVLGTSVLLNTAKKYWKNDIENKRFIQISTDEVYGSLPEDDPEVKFTERTPLNPHSPYSASKTSADMIAKSFFDTYGFPLLVTRCSNNYGPFQFPEKLIPVIISKAMKNEYLPVYGDGKNIRDWLFVDDHCSAIRAVLDKGSIGEIYNIGGNNEIQNIEIVKMILDYLGKPHSLITYVKDRLGHDRRYAIDASKIKKEIGWEPVSKFEEKIIFTIEWYVNNQKWIEDIITGKYQSER
ncbi:MAG: dTDP-glucose 4,6-dehydratase [Candidatus Delongbacteria bacterium]|jgi:dTDP-glucose 4,6-dehydratase|nr:dTDP-glucose 4,6-dehydratase [Candidatus Delongbacteria bacterium]